mmetsp:Transcript_24442/g.77195  ORF Transcript_24442/g.77195 Transcript_24442/m.77195 type:complete len:536 (+) Transcript_24442:148-1755(+)
MQAKLIQWMLQPNPMDRPGALEALRSDLLPPRVEDEAVSDVLRSLPDSPATHSRIVEGLFDMGACGVDPASRPGAPSNRGPTARGPSRRAELTAVLHRVFSRHGAVPMESVALGHVPSAGGGDGRAMVKLLTDRGEVLGLRQEMRMPFAEWAAGARASSIKRFEVARVFREGALHGSPRSFLQADFDVLWPEHGAGAGGGAGALPTAETIKVAAEVLEETSWAPEFEVRLGHTELLTASMRFAGVPPDKWGAVGKLVATAASSSLAVAAARAARWAPIRAGLEGLGLGRGVVARMEQLLLRMSGDHIVAVPRLRAAFLVSRSGAEGEEGADGAIEHLEEVIALLTAWRVAPVLVDPLLPPHAEYYGGCLFQVHIRHRLSLGDPGATMCIAVGGRFDGLLGRFWTPKAGAPPAAVGLTINAERLAMVAMLRKEGEEEPPGAADSFVSQAEVLVCCRGGGGLLDERAELLAELWAAGVKAETVYGQSPSVKEQYEHATLHGIRWLVLIEQAAGHAVEYTARVRRVWGLSSSSQTLSP